MNKILFEEYAKIKNQLKLLTFRARELEPLLLDEMADNDRVESEWGTFSKVTRTTWAYTSKTIDYKDKVKDYIQELKAKEEDEQKSGEAIPNETIGLMFKVTEQE